jgi:hypothetical protein
MKTTFLIMLCVVMCGCTSPPPAERPQQKFKDGDIVTTTTPGTQVSGIIVRDYYDQYWTDDCWSHRVKYLNKQGDLRHEWFSEHELESTEVRKD